MIDTREIQSDVYHPSVPARVADVDKLSYAWIGSVMRINIIGQGLQICIPYYPFTQKGTAEAESAVCLVKRFQ